MATIDWSTTINLQKALETLHVEMIGDWHQDPWGWPELEYMVKTDPSLAYSHCGSTGTLRPALIDVPKENWGSRPAVVLDVKDRLVYQALVDRLSVNLIGGMSPNVYGWRLPPSSTTAGAYSHNNKQWDGYRDHLSLLSNSHEVALASDLVSFFSSIPVDRVQEAIQDRCGSSKVRTRLCGLVESFGQISGRSGLPQRSTASAVIANMYLSPIDDLLQHHASALLVVQKSKIQYHSFARWMDDIWLFTNDEAKARLAQAELQQVARSIGMNLNSAKTDVYEGEAVRQRALQIDHSAVDSGILMKMFGGPANFAPLEELIDRLLSEPERASRTSVKFATQRMRENRQLGRAPEFALAAKRMPHAADALSRLFKESFTHSSMQDWYLEYAQGDWASYEWSVAQLGRIFPSGKRVRKPLREFFSKAVRDANTSLPLLSVASQRLASWDAVEARSACRDAFAASASPHARRVLALTALQAGETRTQVRSWLRADPENDVTLKMVEANGFGAPKVTKHFAS